MIKMIVSDMDGTLLNSNKEVSRANREAIRQAQARGVKMVLATGRIFVSAKQYAKDLGLDTPIIACNGALVKNPISKEIFENKPIAKERVEDIIEVLERERVYYHFYTEKDFYTRELKYTSLSYLQINEQVEEENRINLMVVKDLERVARETRNVMKFVIIDEDPSLMRKVREQLTQVNGIEISQSWHNNLEVMTEGISKGDALEKVAAFYSIPPQEVLAIGDHLNDISMIKRAGYGVAMGNAEQEVRSAAVYVTTSNDEDGFAQAIRHFERQMK